MRILTWHVHGNYLWYLSHTGHDLFVPVDDSLRIGYGGRGTSFPWPDTVHEVPTDAVAGLDVDCVLYQAHEHWLVDRHRVLSEAQRRGPQVFLEHDPPREHPTDTRHPVDDPEVVVVHVTSFNRLMWDNGVSPTVVVEHGVAVPDGVHATYELARGVAAVNCLARRGRRLGADVFLAWRANVPLDLVGMEAEHLDGLGEVPPMRLPAFMAAYRFFANPIRYTSLGLAVCEAMTLGLPVVALATTELATVVESGVHGFVATDPDELVEPMLALCRDPRLARELGVAARERARERFAIGRFRAEWDALLDEVVGRRPRSRRSTSPFVSGSTSGSIGSVRPSESRTQPAGRRAPRAVPPAQDFERSTVMEQRTVRDVMRTEPVSVTAGTTLVDAARRMRDEDIGDVLVTEDEQLRGILTDRDIVVRAVAERSDLGDICVGDLCSGEVLTVRPDEPLDRAVQMMREHAIRRLPVTDGERPVGVLSLGDLALEADPRSALADISAAPPNN